MRTLTDIGLLNEFEFGRTFLANLHYLLKNGLLADKAIAAQGVSDVLSALVSGVAESENVRFASSALLRNYHPSTMSLPHNRGLATALRVVRFQALIGGARALLQFNKLQEDGFVRDTGDPQRMKDLADLAKDPASIHPGATVQTYHPFAWVTSSAGIAAAIAGLVTDPTPSARELSRTLALSYDDGTPLFLLNFPSSLAPNVLWRRPGAFEGIGNRYFKAITDHDTPRPSAWGYTLDVASAEASTAYATSHDGSEEYATLPVRFSSDFSVTYCGNFDSGWVLLDEVKILSILTRTDPASINKNMELFIDTMAVDVARMLVP